MAAIPALQSAVLGIQRGISQLNSDANTIARAPIEGSVASPEVVDALVGLTEDRLQVTASAKALKSVDDSLGSLLDVLA